MTSSVGASSANATDCRDFGPASLQSSHQPAIARPMKSILGLVQESGVIRVVEGEIPHIHVGSGAQQVLALQLPACLGPLSKSGRGDDKLT